MYKVWANIIELVNLIWLRDASVNGMVNLRRNVEEEVWKKYICERIQEVGKEAWKDVFKNTKRGKEYVRMKECPRRKSFADGGVGAKVRLMVREGCLPVRGSGTMKWKYQNDLCGCGQEESKSMYYLNAIDMDKSENDGKEQ